MSDKINPLQEHFNSIYLGMLETMGNFLGFRPKPVPLRITNWPLPTYCEREITISQTLTNPTNEYGLAHEVGHQFHDQNPKVKIENRVMWEWSRQKFGLRIKNQRMIRTEGYHELVAEFFAMSYFDHTDEGMVGFSQGRARGLIDHEDYKLVRDFYFSLSEFQREHVCNWLVTQSYQEARKSFNKHTLFKECERITNRWRINRSDV